MPVGVIVAHHYPIGKLAYHTDLHYPVVARWWPAGSDTDRPASGDARAPAET